MPGIRKKVPEHEYGYKEPEKIPEGRISIKQAMEMLNRYSADPKVHSAQVLAKDYKLKPVHVQSIVKHFQALLLQMPLDKHGKKFEIEGMNVEQKNLTAGALKKEATDSDKALPYSNKTS